ncbi:uncharacterized protein LOC106773047 [Vigna radiata var. radiata]|uniref:Uncharacterized protein LOC106773047 n=1 Tax=Vigna radiata var. radiata TaxID=3916 RepID=A0A3Q0FH53_VIGRR|nr:uncharacterized protein LOC106773047 [Vigna radiata var. radiata]
MLRLVSILVLSWILFSPCHAQDSGSPKETQNGNPAPQNNSIIPLAASRTYRIDPSNDFNYYDGGWDITNTHYYMSLAFSGVPPVAVAVVWFFMVAIVFTLIALLSCCGCCKGKHSAEIGGFFLYTGLERFQITANDVSDVLVTKANSIFNIVENVVTNLAAAKNIQVAGFTLPDDIKQGIEIAEDFTNEADIIRNQAEKTARISMEFLKAISESLIIVGSMMLILAAIGFMVSFLGWKVVVYILVFFGWILVTITFLLSSLSLVVHNGVADTCVAIDEWVQHPRSESALSKLLPCMDEATTQKTLDISKNTSYLVVNLVNEFVVNIANNDNPPMADKDIKYNQSGPALPLICNPFFPNMTERKCETMEISLQGAPTAYKSFLCNTSPSGVCITVGRLTPSLYSKVMVATNLSDSLYRNGPVFAGLLNCSFVIGTFDQINNDDCPSFKRNSHQIFIGLVVVSTAVMFSVILWVVFVKERQVQMSAKKIRTRTATPVVVPQEHDHDVVPQDQENHISTP